VNSNIGDFGIWTGPILLVFTEFQKIRPVFIILVQTRSSRTGSVPRPFLVFHFFFFRSASVRSGFSHWCPGAGPDPDFSHAALPFSFSRVPCLLLRAACKNLCFDLVPVLVLPLFFLAWNFAAIAGALPNQCFFLFAAVRCSHDKVRY
jgi:hypothetical protein